MDISSQRGKLIPLAAQPKATWPGGTTRELYTYPASATGQIRAAELYIGTAEIVRDGPYSVFPNRTRIHMPIRGAGLHLHFQEPTEAMLLTSLTQATFPGDRPLQVTLVEDAVTAFNMIFVSGVTASVASFSLEPRRWQTFSPQPQQSRVLYLVGGGGMLVDEAGKQIQFGCDDAYVETAAGTLHFNNGPITSHLVCATFAVDRAHGAHSRG